MPKDVHRPGQYEWNVFIDNIRKDRPHNELKRAIYSDLTTLMRRAASHTGQQITWDQIMESTFQFCDYLDDLDYDSPAPREGRRRWPFPRPHSGTVERGLRAIRLYL